MVFSTDPEVSRRMLSVNDPASLLMAVHPSAKDILGPNNLAFMHGPAHKAIRKSFLALFTRCALAVSILACSLCGNLLLSWQAMPRGSRHACMPAVAAVRWLCQLAPEVLRRVQDGQSSMRGLDAEAKRRLPA